MKTLYLVRHAKSDWNNILLPDFERPLNERGKKDAPHMAKRLKEKEVAIDHVLSSPAKRALTTCREFCRILGISDSYITTNPKLYHADVDALLESIRTLNNNFHSVMLFGHNPGITEFANTLFSTNIENIPTAGIVVGTFKTDSWEDIQPASGTFMRFDFPKNADSD